VYTGLRPGEKLHEELFHNDESLTNTDADKIHLAATREVSSELVSSVFSNIEQRLDTYDSSLSDCIKDLVPEYIGTD